MVTTAGQERRTGAFGTRLRRCCGPEEQSLGAPPPSVDSKYRMRGLFPSRHLRHDPQLLKILFAEDRHVRRALMILSQCDITADERA